MEVNQFVDSYVVKKTKFLEQHNKMQAPNIHLSCICQFIFKITSSYRHSFLFDYCHLKNVKLFMDALHIPYVDVKDELQST